MDTDTKDKMTFLEHLEEFRWMIIRCFIALVICFIPCAILWKRIFDLMMIYPLRFSDPTPILIYTSPVEGVILSIKIAAASAVLLSVPVLFYQFWKFLSPALYEREKRLIIPIVAFSTVFFLGGVVFCYLALPFVLKFLVSFAAGRIEPMFRIDEYLGFLIKLSLSFGIVFQLPVVSFFLARTGVITYRFLTRNVTYAVVCIFIIAAILTPPDIFTQLILALPLFLLYGLSILVAALAGRKSS